MPKLFFYKLMTMVILLSSSSVCLDSDLIRDVNASMAGFEAGYEARRVRHDQWVSEQNQIQRETQRESDRQFNDAMRDSGRNDNCLYHHNENSSLYRRY